MDIEIDIKKVVIFGTIGIISFILLLFGIGAGMRKYDVWAERKIGEAQFARAESTRKIKTLEAKATQESSHFLAEAEIIRAKGVAEANRIIGDSLKGNETYLRYLWIHNLENTNNQIIYVPTEGALPILEAGKR